MSYHKPKELGQSIDYGCVHLLGELYGTLSVNVDDVIAALKSDAAFELPPSTRFEIRRKCPSNYGRGKGLAWYWSESFDSLEKWESLPAPDKRECGYELVQRCVTPASPNP